jgi:hypothetical protein
MYSAPEPASAAAVASAAPATPMRGTKPAPKMSSGSKNRLSAFEASETLRGVTLSSRPR